MNTTTSNLPETPGIPPVPDGMMRTMLTTTVDAFGLHHVAVVWPDGTAEVYDRAFTSEDDAYAVVEEIVTEYQLACDIEGLPMPTVGRAAL